MTSIRCPRCGTDVPPRLFPKDGPACRVCLRKVHIRSKQYRTASVAVLRSGRRGGAR